MKNLILSTLLAVISATSVFAKDYDQFNPDQTTFEENVTSATVDGVTTEIRFHKFSNYSTTVGIKGIYVNGKEENIPLKVLTKARVKPTYWDMDAYTRGVAKVVADAHNYAEAKGEIVNVKSYEVTVRQSGKHLHAFVRHETGKIDDVSSKTRKEFFASFDKGYTKAHDKLLDEVVQDVVTAFYDWSSNNYATINN